MEEIGANVTVNTSILCGNNFCKIANYIWIIISPVIFVFGLTGGFLIILVLIRIKFQRSPLMFFIFILTVTDMTILCVGLVRIWILETWNFDIRSLSEASCRLLHFLIYFLMQYSSWILVFATLERFIKCRYIMYKSWVTMKKCIIIVILLFIFLAALNSHYFWTHSFVITENNVSSCNVTPGYETFDDWYIKIDLFILCVIPFCIMLSLDIIIMKSLKAARTFRRSSVAAPQMYSRMKKVDRKLTKMSVITNVYFLVSTLPVSLLFILTVYLDSATEPLFSIFTLCGSIVYTLQYSNYAVNYIFYTIYDKRIRKQLTRLLRIAKPRFRQKGSQYTLRSSSMEMSQSFSNASTNVSIRSISENVR
ncbi:C-C chemokine receptor type 1-like [Saccostrea echinata]|uniref:C-C chemokine receptor type 1-like n=1 Tax=Saccostrea echinata TaxID=191078 RepID=UPI002A7F58B8|nr:C-C chemokine receptor type 1-like [Saccostrea echinata]